MSITRRDACGLLLGAPAWLAAAPRAGWAGAAPEDDLRRALAATTPHDLRVLSVAWSGPDGLSVAIELHWPPGMRRRIFRARAADRRSAARTLVDEVGRYMTGIGAAPGPDGTVTTTMA